MAVLVTFPTKLFPNIPIAIHNHRRSSFSLFAQLHNIQLFSVSLSVMAFNISWSFTFKTHTRAGDTDSIPLHISYDRRMANLYEFIPFVGCGRRNFFLESLLQSFPFSCAIKLFIVPCNISSSVLLLRRLLSRLTVKQLIFFFRSTSMIFLSFNNFPEIFFSPFYRPEKKSFDKFFSSFFFVISLCASFSFHQHKLCINYRHVKLVEMCDETRTN